MRVMFFLSLTMEVRLARSYAFLGGPSIGMAGNERHSSAQYPVGDIRSRLIRLIPSAPTSSPLEAIRNLLAYRLPAHYTERQAREEWREIVEGRSSLWRGIPNDRKETIRGIVPSILCLQVLRN